jgi:hypothetical protein
MSHFELLEEEISSVVGVSWETSRLRSEPLLVSFRAVTVSFRDLLEDRLL